MIPSLRSLLPAILFLPLAARGTIVTTVTDEDDGALGGGTGVSLREAVKYSAAGDIVTFDAALSGQTVRLILGEIIISQSLTIDGSALAARITLSGDKTGDGKTADDSRVIQINNNTAVILNTLAVVGGGSTSGGGIRISGINGGTTQVTLLNCRLTGNSASALGGAIYCAGNLDIENSSFSDNSSRAGGGLHVAGGMVHVLNTTFSANSASAEGGGVYNHGTLTLQNSVITGNTATVGGGIFSIVGMTLLENSVVSGNTTSASGGGIYNSGSTITFRNSTCSGNFAESNGGGIYQYFGSLLVENSTVAGNTAKGGGGGLVGDAGTVGIRNSTVCGNTANSFAGGGITNDGATTTLENSIVTGNAAPSVPSASNISGTYTGANNLTSGNALLAPLGDYGGPTRTMPPLHGSPAIETGGTTTLTTDQRGFPRQPKSDIGAVEYQFTTDPTRFWNLDFDGDGFVYGAEQALGTDFFVADVGSTRHLTVPAFDAAGHAVLSFGLNSAAVQSTRWILHRSSDLSPGSFSEIFRTNRVTDTAAPGVTFVRTASSVTVTDENPLPGGAFYRFEARLGP
jgi:predicted outer membrane repeat protein